MAEKLVLVSQNEYKTLLENSSNSCAISSPKSLIESEVQTEPLHHPTAEQPVSPIIEQEDKLEPEI